MNRKSAFFLLAAVLLVLPLTGFSCSQKAAEKAAEKAIEKSTNGKAEVEVNNASVTVNTNGTSWQAGEQVSLPADFPSDVYVIDGTIKSAITTTENQGTTLSIETTKSVEDARALYESKLKGDGWTITANAVVGDSASLFAEKGKRATTVSISRSDNRTTVVVNTVETEDSADDAPG